MPKSKVQVFWEGHKHLTQASSRFWHHLKVSKSQKQFFLKPHCPDTRKIASQGRILSNIFFWFLGNEVSRNNNFSLNHLLLRLISTLLKLEISTLLTLEISSFRRDEISSFRRVEISKQTSPKADDSNFWYLLTSKWWAASDTFWENQSFSERSLYVENHSP